MRSIVEQMAADAAHAMGLLRQHDPAAHAALVRAEAEAAGLRVIPTGPRIVCLCGSTRFWRTFQQASLAETMAGRIVLSIGAASGTDDEHFGNLPREQYDAVKADLDALHCRKIDLADEILVLNVGGYVGESTTREVRHAIATDKAVRWWEPDAIPEAFAALRGPATEPPS